MKLPDITEVIRHYPEIRGIHEVADIFPLPSEEDFTALCDDIRENGLSHPIVIDENGLIVDGRSRLMATFVIDHEIMCESLGDADPLKKSVTDNLKRRHLTQGQKAMVGDTLRGLYEQEAKERQREAGKNTHANQYKSAASGNVALSCKPEEQTRDKVAKAVGVGAKSIDKARDIRVHAPHLVNDVKSAGITIEAAHKVAKVAKQKARNNAEQSTKAPAAILASIITVGGQSKEIPEPKAVRFNKTNANVEWASWTWNPVTGCNHGCTFCYAREIAHMGKMASVYPFQFEPSFHEYRLSAPKNTARPTSDDPRDGRVFVCSMADLFGKWVPDKWIRAVFDACMEAPEWEYLFLTKWPRKYSMMPLLPHAWYGASVIKQADVTRIEKNMSAFESPGCVKWVSLEPLLEPIKFNDLSWCDLMVIGAQTSTVQPTGAVPAFAPKFDWIVDVVNQCREFDVPYYIKPNAGRDAPGMDLPKMNPRRESRLAT